MKPISHQTDIATDSFSGVAGETTETVPLAGVPKKVTFARRAQGLEPVEYPHPSLESCLRSTYGVVAYEEHILQICEAFAGMAPGQADLLRRALAKYDHGRILELRGEFTAAAEEKGRTGEEIARVWGLVSGFQGYAFCRAHSTAYGVEAYEAAWLKRYYPLEFMAAVLTHGKGFYSRLVYSIECRRLGIGFLPPDVNLSRDHYHPENGALRLPLGQVKGQGKVTLERWAEGRPFASLSDFQVRTRASTDEMMALIRAGAFDGFGATRTRQFWEFRRVAQWPGALEPGLFTAQHQAFPGATPEAGLTEPSHWERLKDEQELLGFTVSGHPLELYPDIAWDTYCPIADMGRYPHQRVTVAGLIIEDRLHHQVDGQVMKFISLCDPGGTIECELFAETYRRFGAQTVRYPVVEVTGLVEPFPNAKGHTLRVEKVGPPRRTTTAPS